MKLYKKTGAHHGSMAKFTPLKKADNLERVLEDLVKIIRKEDTFEWCLLEAEALGILAEIRSS